jgi:hypothetical protein
VPPLSPIGLCANVMRVRLEPVLPETTPVAGRKDLLGCVAALWLYSASSASCAHAPAAPAGLGIELGCRQRAQTTKSSRERRLGALGYDGCQATPGGAILSPIDDVREGRPISRHNVQALIEECRRAVA